MYDIIDVYHMNKKRRWTEKQLKEAVIDSKSYRNVIKLLGLKPTGGNYDQIKKYIKQSELSTSHFTGKVWNKGLKFPDRNYIELKEAIHHHS